MASTIRFDYVKMRTAANTIRDISKDYSTAATTLESNFTSAISSWEGESHDAMVTFISVPVMDYMNKAVPQLLNALAELLDANADQMEKADAQIAEQIPKN